MESKRYIFLFKNIISPTKLGLRFDLFAVILFPTSENNLSEGTDVGQIPKYLRAIVANTGKRVFFCFHQSNGSVFLPSSSKER